MSHGHGHAKAEERNLALHRLAFEKLRADPEQGRQRLLQLLEQWLAMPHLERQAPLLERWRQALDLPLDELESRILAEDGQTLRQCSPMGVLISPQERFAVYRELMQSSPGSPG